MIRNKATYGAWTVLVLPSNQMIVYTNRQVELSRLRALAERYRIEV